MSEQGAAVLNQVIANERGNAAVLRAKGHGHDADLIEGVLDVVARVTLDYRTFVSEADAALRSGKTAESFRKRFTGWLELGLAELRGRRRMYSLAVVPRRADLEEARVAAEQAAASIKPARKAS